MILLRPVLKKALPMFSSKSFMVSSLMFDFNLFLTYFCAYERVVWFDSLAYSCSVFPKPFIEEAIRPSIYSYLLCQRVIVNVSVGLFLSFLFCSTDLCVCFCASIIYFYFCSSVVPFEVRKCGMSRFARSQDCYRHLAHSVVPYKFQNSLFQFDKKCHLGD